VCVGWVVISLYFLRMFLPVPLLLVRGVVIVYFFLCGHVFMVMLCGSNVVVIAFLPKKLKKKIALSTSLVVITFGVVTRRTSMDTIQ